MEKSNKSSPEEVAAIFERGLSNPLASPENYLELFLSYCDYQRRLLPPPKKGSFVCLADNYPLVPRCPFHSLVINLIIIYYILIILLEGYSEEELAGIRATFQRASEYFNQCK